MVLIKPTEIFVKVPLILFHFTRYKINTFLTDEQLISQTYWDVFITAPILSFISNLDLFPLFFQFNVFFCKTKKVFL